MAFRTKLYVIWTAGTLVDPAVTDYAQASIGLCPFSINLRPIYKSCRQLFPSNTNTQDIAD